jgi:hypothetical protein
MLAFSLVFVTRGLLSIGELPVFGDLLYSYAERSEQRYSQDRFSDKFPQHVAGGRHHGTRVSVPEQSLDVHTF